MDLTPKQQTSEAIRQATSILVVTGQNPTIDQAVAVLALSAILRKFGKRVSAVISDPIPSSLNGIVVGQVETSLVGLRDFILKVDLSKSEVDKLKYTIEDGKLNIHITPFKGGFAPSDITFGYGSYHYDIIIALGVPAKARIDRIFTQMPEMLEATPILNIDFHRSNENYGAVNLIDSNAASLCEILVALSESLQTGLIDEPIATTLLAGIMSSTDRFTAQHTTAKALTVAAQMMAAGGRQQDIVRALWRPDRPKRNDNPRRDRPQPRRDNGAESSQASKPETTASSQSDQPDADGMTTIEMAEPAPTNPVIPPQPDEISL